MSFNSMEDLRTPRRSTTRASCSVKHGGSYSSLGGDDVAVHSLSPSRQLQTPPRKSVPSSSASAAAVLSRGHGAARANYATMHEPSRKTRRLAPTTASPLMLDVRNVGTASASGGGGEKSGGSSNNSSFALDGTDDGQESEDEDEVAGPAPPSLPSSHQPRCGNIYVPSLPTLVFNEEASNPIAHPIDRDVGRKDSLATEEADASAQFCSVELGDEGPTLGGGIGGSISNNGAGVHDGGNDGQTRPLRPLTLLERRKREKRLLSISHLSTLSMETIHEDRHTCEEADTQTHSPPKPLFRGWSDEVAETGSSGSTAAAHKQRGEDTAGSAGRRRPLATRNRGRAKLPSYTLPTTTAAAATSPAAGASVTESRRDPTCGAVRLVSYNILADRLVRSDDYPGCPPEMLAEEYRVNLVKQELAQAAPHLVILEEMSVAVFEAPQSLGDYLRGSLCMEGDHVASTDSRGTVQCHATLASPVAARPTVTARPAQGSEPEQPQKVSAWSTPDTRHVDSGSGGNGACLQVDAIAEAAMLTTAGNGPQGLDCPSSPRARRKRNKTGERAAADDGGAAATTMMMALAAPSVSVSASETTTVSQTLPPVVSAASGGLVGSSSHVSSVATVSATTVASAMNGGSGNIGVAAATSTMPPISLDAPALTSPLTSSHESGGTQTTSLPHLRASGPLAGEAEAESGAPHTAAVAATPSLTSPSSSLVAAAAASARRTELDGVAIFYDRRRFRLLEKVPLYFNQIAAKEQRLTAYERKKLQTNTHNVALISVLHDLQRPDRVYIVAAVHLIWQRVESQLWQAHHLLCTMDQLKRRYGRLCALQLDGNTTRQGALAVTDECNALYAGCRSTGGGSDAGGSLKVTCIVAGDFNADRTSPAFQYLCTGVVPTQCPMLHYWQDELSSSSAVAPPPTPPADTAALLARSPRAAWVEAPHALRGLLHGTLSPSSSSVSTQRAAMSFEMSNVAQSMGSQRATTASPQNDDDDDDDEDAVVLRSHAESETGGLDVGRGRSHYYHHHPHRYPLSAKTETAGATAGQSTIATTLSSRRPAAPHDLVHVDSTPPSLRPTPPLLQPQSSSFRSFTLSPHLSRPVSGGGAAVAGQPTRQSREGWAEDDCTVLMTATRRRGGNGEDDDEGAHEELKDGRKVKCDEAEGEEKTAVDLPQLHRLSTAPPDRATSDYAVASPPPPQAVVAAAAAAPSQSTSGACDNRSVTTPVRSMMLLGASFLRRLPSPGRLPLSTSQPPPPPLPPPSHHTRSHPSLHKTRGGAGGSSGEHGRNESKATTKSCTASGEAVRPGAEQLTSTACCTPRQLAKSAAVLPPRGVPGRTKSGSRSAVLASGTRREVVKELLSAVKSPSRGLREGGMGVTATTVVSPQPLRIAGRSPPPAGTAYARPQLTFARYGRPRTEIEPPSLSPSRRARSETGLLHGLRLTDAYAAYCRRYPTRVSGMHSSVNMEGRVVDHVLFEDTHTTCSHVLHLGEVAAIPNRNVPSDHYMVGAILVPRGARGEDATFDT